MTRVDVRGLSTGMENVWMRQGTLGENGYVHSTFSYTCHRDNILPLCHVFIWCFVRIPTNHIVITCSTQCSIYTRIAGAKTLRLNSLSVHASPKHEIHVWEHSKRLWSVVVISNGILNFSAGKEILETNESEPPAASITCQVKMNAIIAEAVEVQDCCKVFKQMHINPLSPDEIYKIRYEFKEMPCCLSGRAGWF